MAEFRLLGPSDEGRLETFLLSRVESSVFLLDNLRQAGLSDRGGRHEASYAAVLVEGVVAAVVAHCRNGVMLLQASEGLAELLPLALKATRRPISGFVGPWGQIETARRLAEPKDRPVQLDSRQRLCVLALSDLRIPPILADGAVRCRAAEAAELERLAPWREAYNRELLGMPAGAEAGDEAREELARLQRQDNLWVLTDGGEPVAMAAFNAALPEIVQVGGVFTPPALRGQGYGRAAVAGALRAAAARGAAKAVLFHGERNPQAGSAYAALGFVPIGDYGLVLYEGYRR